MILVCKVELRRCYDFRCGYYWRTELLGSLQEAMILGVGIIGAQSGVRMMFPIMHCAIVECAPQNYVIPGRGACCVRTVSTIKM